MNETAPSLGSEVVAAVSVQVVPREPHELLSLDESNYEGRRVHDRILRELEARARAGEDHIKRRAKDWREVDQHMALYVDLEASAKLGDKSEDPRHKETPWGRVLSIPVTYANVWTLNVMEFSVHAGRDPLVHLEGRGPEDWRAARLMEAVLRYDMEQSRALLTLFQAIQDKNRYGVSFLHDWWEQEEGWDMEFPPDIPPEYLRLLPPSFQRALSEPRRVWRLKREYASLAPVDPYRAIPDPRVAIGQSTRAEFFGYSMLKHIMDIEEREIGKAANGLYFNVAQLKRGHGDMLEQAGFRDLAVGGNDLDIQTGGKRQVIPVRTLDWRLVPAEYGLSPSTRPEVWRFTWSGNVIIRAHPLANVHGEIAYSVGQSHYDQHAAWTPGVGELSDGFQRFVSFLVNSNVQVLMHGLYGMGIFDPALVHQEDLENPGPGRWVRVTPLGSEILRAGGNAAAFVAPLQRATDIGQSSAQAQELYGWAQRMFGVNDPIQAMPLPTKRTLGEIQTIMGQATGKIQTAARIFDAQVLQPTIMRMVMNRQQFTSLEQWFRLSGELARQLGGVEAIRVGRRDIWGRFDYVPHTGAMPMDPARSAEVWLQLLQMSMQIPPLAQRVNVQGVIEEIARLLGARYFSTFINQEVPGMVPQPPTGAPGPGPAQVNVVPDEQLMRMAQAGNAVPLTQMLANMGRG